MTHSRPLVRPLRAFAFGQIPFVTSQVTQVPQLSWRRGRIIRRPLEHSRARMGNIAGVRSSKCFGFAACTCCQAASARICRTTRLGMVGMSVRWKSGSVNAA
jgi:hypothetical protein